MCPIDNIFNDPNTSCNWRHKNATEPTEATNGANMITMNIIIIIIIIINLIYKPPYVRNFRGHEKHVGYVSIFSARRGRMISRKAAEMADLHKW